MSWRPKARCRCSGANGRQRCDPANRFAAEGRSCWGGGRDLFEVDSDDRSFALGPKAARNVNYLLVMLGLDPGVTSIGIG